MLESKRPLKVFLCHAHSDQTRVRDLYNRLTKDGVDVWLDKEKLEGGHDWEFEIRKAVRESDVVVVCLSKQFNQAGFRQKEVRLALDTAMEQPEGEIFIIPLRLEECENLESLRKWHWVNYFEDDGYERLMRSLRRRADNLGITLKVKKSLFPRINTQPNKINKPLISTEKSITNETSKPKIRFQDSKNFRRLLGVLVLIGLGLAMIYGLPPLIQFERLEPTTTATHTETLKTFTPTFINNTPTISLTPTQYFTNTPTPLPTEITDKSGVEMVLVTAGEFVMGSEEPYNNAKPVHLVYLDDFYIDLYEVTNVLYKSCVDSGVCTSPSDFSAYDITSYYGNPEYDHFPVIYVNWFQALSYCEWRDARLPTEAEWEKSARGPNGWNYPWGNSFSYVNVSVYANAYSTHGTVAVGSYEMGKSAYGTYDMAGNVREWVSSLYMPYPYVADDGRENLENNGSRGLRGGSWNYTGDRIITAYKRYAVAPTIRDLQTGFRCAKDVTP